MKHINFSTPIIRWRNVIWDVFHIFEAHQKSHQCQPNSIQTLATKHWTNFLVQRKFFIALALTDIKDS